MAAVEGDIYASTMDPWMKKQGFCIAVNIMACVSETVLE
jgi:hypothetical protein